MRSSRSSLPRLLSVLTAGSLAILGVAVVPGVARAAAGSDCSRDGDGNIIADRWTGEVGGNNTDWHAAANWESGVPTATTDVCINGGLSGDHAYPKVDGANVTIKSLAMTGGTLEIKSNSFTVTAQTSLSDPATVTVDSNQTLTLGGQVTSPDTPFTSSITIGAGSTLGLPHNAEIGIGAIHATGNATLTGSGAINVDTPITSDAGTTLTLAGASSFELLRTFTAKKDVVLGANVALTLDAPSTVTGDLGYAGASLSGQSLAISSTGSLTPDGSSTNVDVPATIAGGLVVNNPTLLTFTAGSGALAASSPTISGNGTIVFGAFDVADDTHPFKLTGDVLSPDGGFDLEGVTTTGAISAPNGKITLNDGVAAASLTVASHSNKTGDLTATDVELFAGPLDPAATTPVDTSNTVGAVTATGDILVVGGTNTATSLSTDGTGTTASGPFSGVVDVGDGTNHLGPIDAADAILIDKGTNTATTLTSPYIEVKDGTNTFGDLLSSGGVNAINDDEILIDDGTSTFGSATTDGSFEIDAGTNTFSGAISADADATIKAGTNKGTTLHAAHDASLAGTNTFSGKVDAGNVLTLDSGTNKAPTAASDTDIVINGGTNTVTTVTADRDLTVLGGTNGLTTVSAGKAATLTAGQNTLGTLTVTDTTVKPSTTPAGVSVGGSTSTKTTATTLTTNVLKVAGTASATLTVSGGVTVLGATTTGDNAHVGFTSTSIAPSLGTDLSVHGSSLYDSTTNDYGLQIAYGFTNANPLVVNGNLLVDGGLLQVNAGNGSVQVPAVTDRTTVLGNDGALNTSLSSDAPVTIGGYRSIRGVLTLNNVSNTLTDGANVTRSGVTGSSAAGTISIPAGRTLTATPPVSGTPVGDELYIRTDVSGSLSIPTNTSLDLGAAGFPGISILGGGLTDVDGTFTAGVVNVGANGKLTGEGTVFTLNNNAGTVVPGSLSADTYTQGSTAKLEVHYSGASPKPVSGITATHAVTLAGQLDLVTETPAPVSDASFHIVTGSVINGDFDTITGKTFGAGLSYQTVKSTGDYTATVTDVSTQLKLVTNSPTVVDGSQFKLTATVSNAKTFPRGQVTFTSDGQSIGTVDLTPTANNQSTAVLDTPDLKPTPTGTAVGNHKIVATYSTTTNGLLVNSNDTIVQKVVSVPSPARALVTTNGDGSATISWSIPDNDGNSPLDGYRLTLTPRSGGAPTVLILAGTTQVVTGLVNGTAYDVKVEAHNAIGFAQPLLSSAALQPDHVTATLTSNAAVIAVGKSATLTGTVLLTGAAPQRALAVKVFQTTANGIKTQVGSTTTDATGKFTVIVSPTSTSTFTVTSGEDTLGPNADSNPVSVGVKFAPTVTSISFNSKTGKLTVKGKMTPRSPSLVSTSKTKVTIKVYSQKGKLLKSFSGSLGATSGGNTIQGSTTYKKLAPARYLVEIDVTKTMDNVDAKSGRKSFTLKKAFPKAV